MHRNQRLLLVYHLLRRQRNLFSPDRRSEYIIKRFPRLLHIQVASMWRNITLHRQIFLWPLWFCRISCNYIVNVTIFGKVYLTKSFIRSANVLGILIYSENNSA